MEKQSTKALSFLMMMVCLFSEVVGDCTMADDCVTDYGQEDCDQKQQYVVENATVKECCRGCELLQGIGGRCNIFNCAPGLKCSQDKEKICILDLESCFYTRHLPPEKQPIYAPRCNPDGTYQAVQCKGDKVTGRCFCSNAVGKRIFGLAWTSQAKNMTCACSRRRADLEAARRNDVTLHCASDGNYEMLQCDSGMCWCVEPTTGDVESMVINENLVDQLPCYDADKFGKQYLRKCESKKQAIALLKNQLTLHGTAQLTMASPNCDYDGTYGDYQVVSGTAYCSWKDDSRIGNWQPNLGANVGSINCNCARDTKYFEEAGIEMTQACFMYGTYSKKQELNGRFYCVDDDGFPVTPLKPEGEVVDCGDWI